MPIQAYDKPCLLVDMVEDCDLSNKTVHDKDNTIGIVNINSTLNNILN